MSRMLKARRVRAADLQDVDVAMRLHLQQHLVLAVVMLTTLMTLLCVWMVFSGGSWGQNEEPVDVAPVISASMLWIGGGG